MWTPHKQLELPQNVVRRKSPCDIKYHHVILYEKLFKFVMHVKAKWFWFRLRGKINWDLQSFWINRKPDTHPFLEKAQGRHKGFRMGHRKSLGLEREERKDWHHFAERGWTGNEDLQAVQVLPGLERHHQVCLSSSSMAPKKFKFHKVIFYKHEAEAHSSGMSQLFPSVGASKPFIVQPVAMTRQRTSLPALQMCHWRGRTTHLAAAAAHPRATARYGHSIARSSAELLLLGCSVWAKSCKA